MKQDNGSNSINAGGSKEISSLSNRKSLTNHNNYGGSSNRRRDNVIVSSRSGSQGDLRDGDSQGDLNDVNTLDNDVYGRSMKEEDINDRIVLLKINMDSQGTKMNNANSKKQL